MQRALINTGKTGKKKNFNEKKNDKVTTATAAATDIYKKRRMSGE